MKPVFLKQLLGTAEKVIYVDNDIYFFSDPVSLFDKLDTNQALLTPHFYASDPVKEQNWLEANFRVGLYNAGFFGASKDATALLDWWAKCCLYAIKKSFWRGLFDDQKYLDLLPVIFEKVGLLKHKGCNVAGWNYKNYAVTRHNKSFFLNGDPLVFIHFAELSMIEFSKSGNPLLDPYNQYTGALNVHKPGFVFRKNMLNAYHFKAYFYYLKWRLLRLVNG